MLDQFTFKGWFLFDKLPSKEACTFEQFGNVQLSTLRLPQRLLVLFDLLMQLNEALLLSS